MTSLGQAEEPLVKGNNQWGLHYKGASIDYSSLVGPAGDLINIYQIGLAIFHVYWVFLVASETGS